MLQFETDARMAQAVIAGLSTMKGYQIIRAPFGGRVTARFTDPGALITNAQTNQVSSQPVMTISDDSRLRVYAYVQQQDVPFVHVGGTAEVVDASDPERGMMAKVSRMTGELDARTRTMQVEVNIDNSEGFLVPGSFAYVTLHVPIKSYPQIPVTGLLTRGTDQFVAVLDDNVVRFKTVKVASTDGRVGESRRWHRPGREGRDQPPGRSDQREPRSGRRCRQAALKHIRHRLNGATNALFS